MAHPFLSYQEIPNVFPELQTETTTEPFSDLVEYISINWINETRIPPKDWSIYGEAVQTNNGVEGWHNALNRWASSRSDLPLYQEAQLVNPQMHLVSNKKLARIQRKQFVHYQNIFFSSGSSMLIVKGTCNNYLGHGLILKALFL